MNTIVQTTLCIADNTLKDKDTFAVRCHRVGNQTYSSMDLCREVGKQILTSFKQRNLQVNLTNPKTTISTEARGNEAYTYTETLQGPSGFPLGSQAKTVCLLSGGIDSPVACWLTMKRGSPTVPIYIDNTPFTDETTTKKAIDTAKKLFEWSIGFPRKIYIVPNGKNLQTTTKKAPQKLTCLLCKRTMYRIAERIAEIEDAEGIVTGEAIGEQASQTMHNLRAIDEAATQYPIHRPLLGFDKTETEIIARKIDTFETSTRKAKSCTAAPNKPATRAKLQNIKEAEEELPIQQMIEDAIKASKTVIV